MALTPEQLNSYKSKYSVGTSSPATAAQNRLSYLKTPVQEEMTFGQKVKEVVKAIPGALISSEKALGKHLGNVMAAPGNVKHFEQAVSDFESQSNRMVEKLNELKAQGKDTSRLNQIFKEYNQKAPQTEDYFSDEQIAELEKGFWQTAGEVGGVALDIATSGTYGTAAKTAKAGQLLTKSDRLARIAEKVGIGSTKMITGTAAKPTLLRILKGGAKQAAEGALVGEAFDITQNLQAGETGLDIFTKGYGKYLGAAVPTVFLGARVGARLAGEVTGVTTGVGFGAIKEGWQASLEGGERLEAFQRGMRNKVSPETLVNEAKTALQTIINNRRSLYRENIARLKDSSDVVDIKPIQEEVKTQLKNFGVNMAEDGTLDYSRSKLRFDSESQKIINTIVKELSQYGTRAGDTTAFEVDKLKQALGSLYSPSSDVRAFVQGVKSMVRKTLSGVGGYDDAMRAYEESTDLIEDIQKGLSLGDKASIDTSFRKLTSALRLNNEFRQQLIRDLDTISGGYLSSSIAGQQMSELFPRGLARPLEGVGAIGALLSGTGIVPILKFAVLASPRAVGEILSAAGLPIRLSRGLINAIEKNISKLKASYDSIPNKQGGFVKNPFQSGEGDGDIIKKAKMELEELYQQYDEVGRLTEEGTDLRKRINELENITKREPRQAFGNVEIMPERYSEDVRDLAERFKQYSKATQERTMSSNWDIETKNKQAKGSAMKDATILRKLREEPTPTEIRDAMKYLNSNYVGKNVIVEGKPAITQGTSFGRIKVKFEDGTIKNVDKNLIQKSKVTEKDAIQYLKNEAKKEAESWLKINDSFNKGSVPQTVKGYKETGDLTTKVLTRLEGKTDVSKQYISDLANSGDIKQVEKDVIRQVLESEGDTVNVTNFAEKVKQELLPLKTIDSLGLGETHGRYVKPAPRYEHVVLPDGIRGNVANYGERVYESPIKTSAGRPHFSGWANDPDAFPENYFGHTRIEDMSGSDSGTKMLFGPKQGVRRVIEVQSDLYQKGNLEREALKLGDKSGIDLQEFLKAYNERNGTKYTLQNVDIKEIEKVGTGWAEPRNSALISDLEKAKDFPKLQQYNNPTAHFRMVREEIKQAAKDGKTKLQFPTGETAMKIERLGQSENNWKLLYDDIETPSGKRPSGGRKLKIEDLEIGQRISDAPNTAIYSPDNDWIITDVLGDGKFKAVPKEYWDNLITAQTHPNDYVRSLGEAQQTVERTKETFDISSKIDTSSPIYKFYEKDLGRYLMNNYKAKIVTDAQGVNWFEIDVNKDWAKLPIQAFGVAPFMFGPDILKKAKEMGYVNADEGELQAIDDEEKVRKNELPSNEEIKRQIAFRESGTVKDPYSAKNDKNSNGQIDYGKYQISNDKIKENSKRFLGKEVTSDEFLNSPELQEEFMDKMIEHLRRLGIKKFDTLLALHRKGFSDISAARIKRLKRNADVIKYLNNKPNAN